MKKVMTIPNHHLAATLATAVIFAVGCATVPKNAMTPSGRPEAIFGDVETPEIAGKLAGRCLDRGLVIEGQTATEVVCMKELTGGDAILATLAIGNSYSTPPVQHVRFNLVQLGMNVRVQAYQWVETQYAFGQVRRLELNGGNAFNGVQDMLRSMGGELP